MSARPLLLAALLVATAGVAHAHEVRPAYLQVSEIAPERYRVLWKVPASGEYRLAIHARLPADCRDSPHSGAFVGGAFVERWQARCPGGLVGARLVIEGLEATGTDVLARVERADGTTQTARLDAAETSFQVVAAPTSLQVARSYAGLGMDHILRGVDHLLFLLGLLFLVGSARRLVATVTAFTLAHSLTLAASTLGWVHVSQAPVEATIALSVVFVATEIVHAQRGQPGLTARAPWLVAFAFGLLHGFGFAGALREIGLPERDVPLALLSFNLGVEAGQLLFVAAVAALALALRRLLPAERRDPLRLPIARAAAYGIGSVAAYWCVQRIASFWS